MNQNCGHILSWIGLESSELSLQLLVGGLYVLGPSREAITIFGGLSIGDDAAIAQNQDDSCSRGKADDRAVEQPLKSHLLLLITCVGLLDATISDG